MKKGNKSKSKTVVSVKAFGETKHTSFRRKTVGILSYCTIPSPATFIKWFKLKI